VLGAASLALGLACVADATGGASQGPTGDAGDAGPGTAGDAGTPPQLRLTSSSEGTLDDGLESRETFAWTQEVSATDDFGARIDGTELTVWLRPGEPRQLRLEVDTAFDPLPGRLPLGRSDGARARLTELVAARTVVYEAVAGRVELTSCPRDARDPLTGSLHQVVLHERTGGEDRRRTLEGTFSTWVAAVRVPALVCREPPGEGEGEPPCEVGPTCTDAPGPCCSRRGCLDDCAAGCWVQACVLQDTEGCTPCVEACLDACGAGDDCREGWMALHACAWASGCLARFDPEAVLACAAEPCCDEVVSALGR